MTGEPARLDTQDALAGAIAALCDATGRDLMVYVPRPDAPLWSSAGVVDALRGFVTARSQRQVLLLFGHPETLARDHAPLVTIAQRLPSLILLRAADPDFARPAEQAFVASDRGQMLLFDSGDRLAATRTDAGERVRPLVARFGEAWERARPLSELRALGL